MTGCGVGVQIQRAMELRSSTRPILIKRHGSVRQLGVGFRDGVVERDRACCLGLLMRKGLFVRKLSCLPHEAITTGQGGVRQGITRALFDGTVKVPDRMPAVALVSRSPREEEQSC